ncbi:co-chaperone DjlA [Gynuella sunshinyii]|uniref:Co-chaperone protein DjlA n=1 Tax=Gynuella sunshinyii YC6258 TaxID=1445510 RepID=A0A0C5W2E4_9GAMM|nr:co-chaperone DjlA [Gynuella sunshinyii]AJQ96844.1 dnaJ-domain-containing protein 1 [Gynuella sunshinyii YC6258]
MSWWGKIVGGAFGFLVGGPIGALLGVVFGHNVDVGAKHFTNIDGPDLSPGEQERVQMAFFTATFSVMGAVAKADGRVSKNEIAMAETVMQQMNLSAEMRQAAQKLFYKGKESDFPLEDVMKQLRSECGRRANLMRMFMEIQVQAAYADGVLHPSEDALLLRLCELLGFHEDVYRQIEALVKAAIGIGGDYQHSGHRAARAEQSMSRKEAFELLGIGSDSSQAEIKKAYRRLMSQHHPDKLVAKGLPEEMVKLATEKTQKIREAYELVRN